MNIRIKLAAASIAAGSALVSMTGVAHAYDCYNASRSTKGATQAGNNSQVWVTIPEALTQFMGFTPDQVTAAMAVIDNDPAVPKNFVIFLNPQVDMELASKQPLANATNGKGIDHSEDNGVLDAVIGDAMSIFG